jgi:hypothetical protein
MKCLPYSTGWQRAGPVPGAPMEPWTCKDSGKRCNGNCRNSWHKDCTLEQELCDCQPGSYRCVGEKKNNMIECDIVRCDVTRGTYEASKCECSKVDQMLGNAQTVGGQCTWMAAPGVTRQMGGHEADKKCSGFNRGDTGAEPAFDCESPQCGRSQFECQGVKDGAPSKGIAVCSTNSLQVCHQTCLLDDSCVAVTWDPPSQSGSGNSTRPGRCYKVNTLCSGVASATGESIYFKEVDWHFPAECMPRQQLAEDTWRLPKLGFSHDSPECTQCKIVEVVLTVSFGSLDIGWPDNSVKCTDPNYDPGRDGNPPRPGLCKQWGKYVEDRYRFNCPSWPASHDEGDGCAGIELAPELSGLPDVTVQYLTSCSGFSPPEGCGQSVTFPGLVLKGPYDQVLQALHNVTYAPAEDQNTARLRSRIYSGSSSRSLNWPISKPFEELTMTVGFPSTCPGCGHGGYVETLVRRYMLHILPMNDRPVLVDPVLTYSRPNYCEPTPELEDCIDDETGEALEEEQCHRCHFGPFWAYEGQSTADRPITGFKITDEDVLESCGWGNQKCTSLDMTVLARNGAFDLNTRLGLAMYRDDPASKGFTANINNAQSAITVLNFRSAANSFNTMHSGQTEEIQVEASDQGFTGATGNGRIPAVSTLQNGVSLSERVRININIVAINTAPSILFTDPQGDGTTAALGAGGTQRYSILEDEVTEILGVSLTDEDLEEDVESTLAKQLWMNDPEFQPYIKKMAVKLQVSRGILFFPVLTNLIILSTYNAFYLTLETRYPRHDLCRARSLVLEPQGATSKSYYANTEVVDGLETVLVKGACAKDLASEGCSTGQEPECACLINDNCANGRILLHIRGIDREDGDISLKYYQDLLYAIATTDDRTCGGVPWYASPFLFTTGARCENDKACQVPELQHCAATGSCRCCANLNVTCASHQDCSDKVASRSLCACICCTRFVTCLGLVSCSSGQVELDMPYGCLSSHLI